jgi:acyl carrier protein
MITPAVAIHERLTCVFQRVFENAHLTIYDDMTARDVERWDSLCHINLITAVEKEFKIRFTTSEIMGLANVGALKMLIMRKVGA